MVKSRLGWRDPMASMDARARAAIESSPDDAATVGSVSTSSAGI
jgi:hypothetical protein